MSQQANLPCCTSCGVSVPADAAGGLCVSCAGAMVMGLFSPTEPSQEPGGPSVSAGTRLGPYILEKELGRGGMGLVWQARHVEMGRLVAVKVLTQIHLPGERETQRFLEEVKAAGRLDHPHIVPVLESGEDRGVAWFAMPLLEGGALGKISDSKEAASLMARVARGLAHSHSRGILHRDIKPGNILLDGEGEPRLADFGLARDLTAEDRLTLSGEIMGTPAYMAPEQAAGTKDATTAADIYGLGAVLYELLVGRPPFRAETKLELLRKVAETEPVRPRSLNAGLDRDLELICLKCLEKEPGRRYATASELAADLERWARGEAIHARPASVLYRAGKWARRRPWRAAAVGLCGMLAMLLGWVAWLWHLRDRELAEKGAVAMQLADQCAKAGLMPEAQVQWSKGTAAQQQQLAWKYVGRRITGDPAQAWQAPGAVTAVAWSADGSRCVAGGKGFVTLCVDAKSWRPVNAPDAVGWGQISSLAVSGEMLAVACIDQPTRIFQQGRWIATLPAKHGEVAFLNENLVLASSTEDVWGAVLCDVAGKMQRRLSWLPSHVAVSSDGKYAVLGGHDPFRATEVFFNGELAWLAWSLLSEEMSPWAEYHNLSDNTKVAVEISDPRWGLVSHVGTGPYADQEPGYAYVTGNQLFVGGTTNVLSATWNTGYAAVLGWDPAGRWLAMSAGRNLDLSQPRDGNPELSLVGHSARVTSVAFGRHGILSGDASGMVRIWDLAAKIKAAEAERARPQPSIVKRLASASALAVASDGTVASGAGNAVFLTDSISHIPVVQLSVPGGLTSLVFSSDPPTLHATGTTDDGGQWWRNFFLTQFP